MKCNNCGYSKTKKVIDRVTFTKYYCESCSKSFKIPKVKRESITKNIQAYFSNSNEKYYWLIFTLFSGLYLFTYVKANNTLIVNAGHDDALYYLLGQNIASGKWLGNYMQLTLAKMPSYAMFIAFAMKTKIPYMWLISLSNIIAVTYLLVKSKYLFSHTKWLLLTMGFFLLFNPILAIYLRIYRFQLPAIFFVIFVATIISLFNPSTKKMHWSVRILEGLFIAIAWGLLWFSREEYLFYLGCLIISLIAFFLVKRNISYPFRNILPVFYGIIGIIGFWLFISGNNYKYYDRFVTCERTSTPFTDVISTFNSIEDPDYPKNVSGSAASREKIIKIAEAVPMFRPMAKNLISTAMAWGGLYLDTDKLEFINNTKNKMTISHFEWAWIDAVAKTGYYKDATTLANYYNRLDSELKIAINEGKLVAKKDDLITFGPYTLSKNDLSAIIGLIPRNYKKLFPMPNNINSNYKNILAQTSNIANEKMAKIWSVKLAINYLTEGDNQKIKESQNSFSNKILNITTSIFANTAMPLIHLSAMLALIAFVLSIIRKAWIFAALISVLSSTYIAHYLIIAVTSVIISYDNAQIAYFLPSYGTMLISSMLSISIIFQLIFYPD